MDNIIFSENLSFHTYIRSHNHHTHQFLGSPRHFFAYMETGSCKIVSEQRTIEAAAGDVFYIPKGLVYHSYWYSETQVQFKSFGFHDFPEYNTRQYPLQVIACSLEAKELLRQLPTGQPADSRLVSQFYGAVATVLPYMQANNQGAKNAIIEKAKEYILHHENCNIGDIAKHCLISEATLYDIFKKEAGCTPNTLRQQITCEKAAMLLKTTDRSVQEISDLLGFSSTSYFRKVLYKHTGKTPLEIRKQGKF